MSSWEYHRFPSLSDGGEGDWLTMRGAQVGTPLSPRFTVEWLRQLEADDPDKFFGQFQGTPRPPEGRLFRESDFIVKHHWEVPRLERWYRAWDLATSVKEDADYTSGALIGVDQNLDIWIRDVVRLKREFPDARKVVIAIAQRDGKDCPIGIEEKVAGLALVQDLHRNPDLLSHTIYPMPAKGDKKQRAEGWAARARLGHLHLVLPSKDDIAFKDRLNSEYADAQKINPHWVQPFINECCSFDGKELTHDDQVDAVSIGWALLHQVRGGPINEPKPIQEGSREHYDALAEAQGFEVDPYGDAFAFSSD